MTYGSAEKAIRRGARSIADLQRKTSACTRCFGCRFELEQLLTRAYGEGYQHAATITIPAGYEKAAIPNPMYMPVLAGFNGYDIDSRVIVYNYAGSSKPAGYRVDLMLPSAERVGTWQQHVQAGRFAMLDLSRDAIGPILPGGAGVAKLVLDRAEVGSLRPYFHFETPTSITTTHGTLRN